MPAGEISARLNLNAAGWSYAVARSMREVKALQTATTEMGHGTVSQMQAASASIRVLEGGMTGNIRAAERFISTIPGVGKALQAAFPVVGGIALAGVFVKIGEEAAKAIQKIEQAPQAISNSFRELNTSAQSANDSLAITNDRLENEIAKLQGKPQNNLAIAIDEARLAADKMAESLDRDNSKIKELLSQNAVPLWAGFLGKAGTGEVSDTVNKQNQHLSDLGNQAMVLQHTDPAAAERIRAQIDAQRQQNIQDNARDIAARRASTSQPGALNQDANLSIDYGQQATLYSQVDQQTELKRNVADQATKQQLEDQKAQQEAAKRAAEAMKQAQELIVKQWQQALDQDKANSDLSTAQEAAYWLYRAETATKGSLSYVMALDEANKDIAKINADTMRQQKTGQTKSQEFDTTTTASYRPDSMDLSRGDNGQLASQGREAAAYVHSLNEQVAAQRQAADAVADQSLEMAVAAGQMSALDAAQVRATMHTQEFEQAWQRLQVALANAAQVPGETGRTMVAGLSAQGAQMLGQRQMQVASDQQAISQQQIGPAVKTALDEMVQNFSNMAASLKTIIPQTLAGLNNDLVKLATGQYKKGDVGHTLLGAGQSLVGAGLRGAEGKLLGSFGLGKRDGSSELSALWVQMAGASAGLSTTSPALSSGVGSLAKLVPGGSFIQPFLGPLISALPHLAGGGDFMADHPMLVGENGPEVINPGFSGSVTPNSALGAGGDTHFHIDARGATDPAAVHAAVMRAAPSIIAASAQTQHSASKRRPSGR